MLLKVLKAD
jgi:hypothetical protein